MVDTFRHVRGKGERKFSYRPRGRPWGEGGDRVDLMLVSEGVAGEGRVRGADVLDEEGERGPSDHVPVCLEVGARLVDGEREWEGAGVEGWTDDEERGGGYG